MLSPDINTFSYLCQAVRYLTAKYIVDNNRLEYLVTNHLNDPRWKEVFLLIAGLMNRGADDLLLLMEKQARKYLDTPTGKQKLIPLLYWADEVTKDSQGNLLPVAKRAIALNISNLLANAKAFPYPSYSLCYVSYALTNVLVAYPIHPKLKLVILSPVSILYH